MARLRLLIAVAALGLLTLTLTPAAQARVVVSSFGSTGELGGQFRVETFYSPSGIGINTSGAGGVAPGTLYLPDEGNSRIQRFSPSGAFERTWGQNVSGPDEQQRIEIQNAAGAGSSTFTLTFGGSTTTGLGLNAAAIETGLVALPSIGAGDVTVAGNSSAFIVRFTGTLSGTDVDQMTIDGSGLKPPASNPSAIPTATVTTLKDGAGGNFTGFEICTVAANCQAGQVTGASNGGQVYRSKGIAVSQLSGHLYVYEQGNRRISEFDADGNFVRAFGWDVVSTGGVGDVSTNAFEVCAVAADCKQAAPAGADGGRFGGGIISHPALDASGNLWVPDSQNRRIQEFSPTGAFIAAYGWDVDAVGGGGGLEKCTSTAPGACRAGVLGSTIGQFGQFSPTNLAFDSAGNLYAPDRDSNRVLRFNPTFTAAASFLVGTTAFEIESESRVAAIEGGNRIAITGSSSLGKPMGIREYDLAGNLVETSIPNIGFSTVEALTFDQSTGRLYGSNSSGTFPYPGRVLVLGQAPAPTSTMDPVTTFTAKTATFTGAVDPMGALVSCTFQYSLDQVSWTDIPDPDCDSLSSGGDSQAVSQDVSGLEPLTHYYARLRVSRLFDDSTTSNSTPIREFTTETLPPNIANVGAVELTDSSATLVGSVNPNKAVTVYHFEYGDQGPCASNPCASTVTQSLSGGNSPVVVSAPVTGLAQSTTYHLRLVADNLPIGGSSQSADVTFETSTGPAASDRAYEMVSSPEKNGGSALSGYQYATVAYDGQAFGLCTDSLFGEPPGVQGALCAQYLSRRTPSGWQTQPATPFICRNDVMGDNDISLSAADPVLRFSLNLDAAAFQRQESASCSLPPLDPAAPLPQKNLYRADYSSPAPSYDLLSPEQGGGAAWIVGTSSDDFTNIAYTSASAQTPDAPAGAFNKIYEWDDGALRLASVKPDGTPFTATAQVPGGIFEVLTGLGDLLNAMSDDGSRLFFETPVGTAAQELYMREGGTATHDVSASECTSSCGASAADSLLLATPDGSKALISSGAKLTDTDTNAAGADLFLYTHGPDPASEQNLTFLSKDQEPADGTKAEVLDVLGLSDDGDVVFFAANGQLVTGEATAGGPKVYRWSRNGGSPTLTYLASPEDSSSWSPPNRRDELRLVTPDGSHLLIRTKVKLEPVADYDQDADYFRWSEADGWVCVSCQFPGALSSGDATGIALPNESFQRGIMMSDDGQRVFFRTSDALVPADVNGKADVYEWHAGAVDLISSGTASEGARFLGASASGEDVFFGTQQRLVGWDKDSVRDVYDARIGGGFPEPPPDPALCEGEGCREATTATPERIGAGSAAFEGPGNVPAGDKADGKRCPKGKRLVKRHGKERCVAHKKGKKKRNRARHERRVAR